MDWAMNKPAETQAPHGTAEPAQLKRGQSAQVQRDLRSKAALKANMAKRKAQIRGKETEAADQGSPEDE
jgi:hypothetical protein